MNNATACALNRGERLAKMGCNFVYLKSKLTHARADAGRAVRKGWRAAEDFVDEVAVTVKRQPLKSIGVTFGVALGIGTFAGWLVTRK
jgi:ElaB/YqjD/DUF883 family membrane-anchored ribosome-binding protein